MMLLSNDNENKLNRNQIVVLIAIVVAFLILQSINFSYRWVDDESWYTMPIPTIHSEGTFRIPTLPSNDVFFPIPPLLTYSEAIIDSIQPLSPGTARSVTLLFGVLTIFAVFLWSRQIFGINVAVFASFFVASDNLVFLASRIVRPEIFVVFFLIMSLYFLNKSLLNKGNISFLVFSGMSSALAVCSHPNGFLATASVAIVLLFHFGLSLNFWKKSIIYGVAFLIFMIPFVVWIIVNDTANFDNFKKIWLGGYGRHSETSLGILSAIKNLFEAELIGRYKDFIQFPFRVHIAVISIALLLSSIFFKNKVYRTVTVIVIFQLLFFIIVNNSNPSVRYMIVLIPFLSVLAGFWCVELLKKINFNWNQGDFRLLLKPKSLIVLTLFFGLGVSQVMGNIFYLWKYRNADYQSVTSQLNEIIPENTTIYGGMSFWLGLREHRFVPYMRTPWSKAVEKYHPEIVIMDDWVMAEGGLSGEWGGLRSQLQRYVDDNGVLIGQVNNSFYGDLKIYQITYKDNLDGKSFE